MKKYYYVQVITCNKLKFVTSVDNSKKVAVWEEKETPKAMPKVVASELANALQLNGMYALLVESMYELDFKNENLQ